MYTSASVFSVLTILAISPHSASVTVNRGSATDIDVTSESRIELKPIEVNCALSDILVISAPIINTDALYYLTRPNGDNYKLDITRPRHTKHKHKNLTYMNDYGNLLIRFFEKKRSIITSVYKYDVFNANSDATVHSPDIFGEKQRGMNANDFMIGPLDHEDYGNWVLSVYYKDEQDHWAEVYQTISLHITEFVPAYPANTKLKPGDDFHLKFAYPIQDLQTCELNVPSSSFDRFYDRNQIEPDSCGYILRNVTKDDTGVWTIVGVGRIVYIATVFLSVES